MKKKKCEKPGGKLLKEARKMDAYFKRTANNTA